MKDDIQLVNRNNRWTVNIVLSLIIVLLIFLIVFLSYAIYYRIIIFDLFKDSTPPEKVSLYTMANWVVERRENIGFEEFFGGLSEDSKEKKDIDLGALNVASDPLFSIESEYYSYCKTKLVNIDFNKSKQSIFRFNYLDYEFVYSVELYNDLYIFSDNLKSENCYFRKNEIILGFLRDPYNQEFMKTIAESFLKLRSEYSDDEIVEIATIFLQSISYETDWTNLNRYPYETFYEGRGNCLDKSIILVQILGELGYKTYLIVGDTDEYHALVGIVCDKGNLIYNGDHICFIETTKFGPIGESVNISNIELIEFSDSDKIYFGENYGPRINQEILSLKQRAKDIENQIGENLNSLIDLRRKMCNTNCVVCGGGDSNPIVNSYMDFCGDASEYNLLVRDYNNLVINYNQKISEWYLTYYEIEGLMFNNVEILMRGRA